MTETQAILALHCFDGLKNRELLKLFLELKSRGNDATSVFAGNIDDTLGTLGAAVEWRDSLIAAMEKSAEVAAHIEEADIKVVPAYAAEYPQTQLHRLGESAPAVLYTWGNSDLLNIRSVGFCGSRDTSPRGLEIARLCAESVVAHGGVVVSGYARGVDDAAHAAALGAGGTTAIILPTGILSFQPKQSLSGELDAGSMVVVSQFLPDAGWHVGFAMQRNKTICALSRVMLLIESGLTGGTFDAGTAALKMAVPLYVLSYDDPPSTAPGNAHFLAHGARAITVATDDAVDLSSLLSDVESGETLQIQRDLFR